MSARFIVGDSLTVLRTMPDASVDLVLTSPPFLALRSYLPPDHPDKELEMGSEGTPGAFLDALLDVIEECARVLAPHGSIAIELGDTYSGSGGAGGDYTDTGLRAGQEKFSGSAIQHRRTAQRNRKVGTGNDGRRNRAADVAAGILAPTKRPGAKGRDGIAGWPLDKSLCLIPELFRFALAYGFNPLTGRTTDRWRVRNVVRWVRPNPPVGALADKFRPATSDLVIACKDRKRYFDLDAVREPHKDERELERAHIANTKLSDPARGVGGDNRGYMLHKGNAVGAPPLDWWVIPPGGYSGSHYAVFPQELCVRPIKAMCPERVCTVCGSPSERIAETTNAVGKRPPVSSRSGRAGMDTDAMGIRFDLNGAPDRAERITTGLTDCGHDAWRRGVVLDPFAGSGTTLAVATGHGRDAIGIDLDERNADLARERVGMWLQEEECNATNTPETSDTVGQGELEANPGESTEDKDPWGEANPRFDL